MKKNEKNTEILVIQNKITIKYLKVKSLLSQFFTPWEQGYSEGKLVNILHMLYSSISLSRVNIIEVFIT